MGEIAVRMPKFSMAQEEGTLISWVKHESDQVSAGDVICEVATDKVDMEVEAPVSGRLTRLVAAEDETVAVGEPIAYIASDSADLLEGLLDGGPDADGPEPVAGAVDGDAEGTQGSQGPGGPGATGGISRALPGARRRAAELSLSLGTLRGTGPGGVVTVSDVETAATASAERIRQASQPARPAVPPADSDFAPPRGHSDPDYAGLLADLRARRHHAIASTITMSTTIPQFTMYTSLDLELAAHQQPGRGWSALLARVLAAALRQSPALNVIWRDGRLEPVAGIGVAIAVDTPIGLLAPVIFDPDQMDPGTLDSQVAELTDAARNGRLRSADLDGATVMLCDLGAFGVEVFQVPLTPPLVVALSVGMIARRPVAAGGGLATRTMCQVGLTVDHRAADASDAARFLRRLRMIAANPDQLRKG